MGRRRVGALSSPRVFAFLRSLRRRPVPMVLYTAPGCGLCEELKAELTRARVSRRYELREVNVRTDPALEARHGRSIPVLEIAGRVAFKGRLSAEEFQRKFERLAAEWESAGESK